MLQADVNLYQAVGAHAGLAYLLPSRRDAIVITTPTCPACVRFLTTGGLDRMRDHFRRRNCVVRHLDTPADDTLRWMLRVAGHTTVPAIISQSSHGSIPRTSRSYHAMSANDYIAAIR